MTDRQLRVIKAGPSVTIQDLGRPGYQRFGVAEGGAIDTLAMAEGAVLLGNPKEAAALEMFGVGGTFMAEGGAMRIALTGTPMTAKLDGRSLDWRTSFLIEPGQVLSIGTVTEGNYGYLHIGGGIGTKPVLSSRSTHIRARLGGLKGTVLRSGDRIPVEPDHGTEIDMHLTRPRPSAPPGIRILWGAQANWFTENERQRFLQTEFKVTAKLDRMGVRLAGTGAPIHSELGLSGLSDAVILGDIQIPGDGEPAVLLADRQPTGGYPRIATIITADLAHMAQTQPGKTVKFELVSEADALQALREWRRLLIGLQGARAPLRRDPREIPNLLDYNLISGVVYPTDQTAKEDTP